MSLYGALGRAYLKPPECGGIVICQWFLKRSRLAQSRQRGQRDAQ